MNFAENDAGQLHRNLCRELIRNSLRQRRRDSSDRRSLRQSSRCTAGRAERRRRFRPSPRLGAAEQSRDASDFADGADVQALRARRQRTPSGRALSPARFSPRDPRRWAAVSARGYRIAGERIGEDGCSRGRRPRPYGGGRAKRRRRFCWGVHRLDSRSAAFDLGALLRSTRACDPPSRPFGSATAGHARAVYDYAGAEHSLACRSFGPTPDTRLPGVARRAETGHPTLDTPALDGVAAGGQYAARG